MACAALDRAIVGARQRTFVALERGVRSRGGYGGRKRLLLVDAFGRGPDTSVCGLTGWRGRFVALVRRDPTSV